MNKLLMKIRNKGKQYKKMYKEKAVLYYLRDIVILPCIGCSAFFGAWYIIFNYLG